MTGSQASPAVKFVSSTWGDIARQRLESEAKKELGKALGCLFGDEDD